MEFVFIDKLSKRIQSLLPNRTGQTIAEVELNPQYVVSKDIFLKTSKRKNFIAQILSSLCNVLEELNFDHTTKKLKDRDENTMLSSLMILRLLSSSIQLNWGQHTKFMNEFITASNGSTSGYALYSYFDPPTPLDSNVVNKCIELLASLLSPLVINDTLNLIGSNHIETTKSELMAPEDYIRYVNEMDKHIEFAFRFIASANPEIYNAYFRGRLLVYSQNNENIPSRTLRKYLPLLKSTFYVKSFSTVLMKESIQAMQYIKSPSWRFAYLVFYATSIKFQAMSRPKDFLFIVNQGTELEEKCKTFFDYVNLFFDESSYFSYGTLVQSWFLILCLGDFHELNLKPNKLKVAFNKRLKFLTQLIKDAQYRNNLESFDALLNFFHLGARISPFDSSHVLCIFTETYLEDVYKNLMDYPSKHTLISNKAKYDNLVINYNVTAIVVNLEKYEKILIEKLSGASTDVLEIRLFVKVLKALAESDICQVHFQKVIKKLTKPLKKLIYSITNSLLEEGNLDAESSLKLEINYEDKDAQPSDSFNASKDRKLNANRFSDTLVLEEVLADLFCVFNVCPELYFIDFELMDDNNLTKYSEEELYEKLLTYREKIIAPISYAFSSRNDNDSSLNECARKLSICLLDKDLSLAKYRGTIIDFSKYWLSNIIVHAIADSCIKFSISDPRFKASFLFFNEFFEARSYLKSSIGDNPLIRSKRYHLKCAEICRTVERCLLMSLNTQDIQLYNIAKISMEWQVKEMDDKMHPGCFKENLRDEFNKIANDNFVFTGFVSLQKRFRSILRNATPTNSLFDIWLYIYQRWLNLLSNKSVLNEENIVFRHYTGFLVATSGCFLREGPTNFVSSRKDEINLVISQFFDKCIDLLKSADIVIRVLIKDALSNELHSAVFHLIINKIIHETSTYSSKNEVDEVGIVFVEQALIIISSMMGLKSEGSFVLATLFPESATHFIKFISMVESTSDCLRLKLRFCKAMCCIECNRESLGYAGAFKSRNFFAKILAEWLEQAVFYRDYGFTETDTSSSSLSSRNSKDVDIEYLNIDLATECSKCLSLELEDNLLEVPEGISDAEIKKYKDLAFASYFSLFYKILQKYTALNQNSTLLKSKYKIHIITENVLKAISNILQFDIDIGMQFVISLGYHENNQIRAIFLNVFSRMIVTRKSRQNLEDFPEHLIKNLSLFSEIYCAMAEVSSISEHNLLASSLFGLFSYTRNLNQLLETLLEDEIRTVSRSTNILRRNSTLTRLLSAFVKDYGADYLSQTIKPFIVELIEKEEYFEIEKVSEPSKEDSELFLKLITKLVDNIINSKEIMPKSFKYVCTEIYNCVNRRFEGSALIAVGSFLFLRFFCPAIISSETYFDLAINDPRAKRTLMQLVKVVQNVANGSLNLVKWPGLVCENGELETISKNIFEFLKEISCTDTKEYPFKITDKKPVAELRYLHKFLYSYYTNIKIHYILKDPFVNSANLKERIEDLRLLDRTLKELGQPRALLQLQNSLLVKNFDSTSNTLYNEFMAKLAVVYADRVPSTNVVHSSIFDDGVPVVVINLLNLKYSDVDFLVYKLFETTSQMWDNKFYAVFDFTEFIFGQDIANRYSNLISQCSPEEFHKNCERIYYFNLAKKEYTVPLEALRKFRESNNYPTKFYTYSLADSPHIINRLCLSPSTLFISRDIRVTFDKAKLFDTKTNTFEPISIKIGRQWMQLMSEEDVEFSGPNCVTTGFKPIEVVKLTDIIRCEISKVGGVSDEFTIYLNNNHHLIIRSKERLEILKFLYFTTSRLSKQSDYGTKANEESNRTMLWFCRLYNLAFHGLLSRNEDVKKAASLMFASLSTYFEIDFGILPSHAKYIAFPTDATDFVVSVSEYLSKKLPNMTDRFIKAFLENYDKIQDDRKMSAIKYLSPWIDNVCLEILFQEGTSGKDNVADIIRQFCKICTIEQKDSVYFNDYIWKKLFNEPKLTPILIDEVVACTIDNRSTGPNWSFTISVITPSVEVCGEIISRLILCINEAKTTDSVIVSQSKLYEIMVLVKIAASLLFNSYVFAKLYLPDIFFITSLFIDHQLLNFGEDLQKLVINTVHSFCHKPDLNEEENKVIKQTILFFGGQKAKMLFALNRESHANADYSQAYLKASGIDLFCNVMKEFIVTLGCNDDISYWKSRWATHATNLSFKKNSIFKERAIVLLGILSKDGINDSAALRILKLITKSDVDAVVHETYLCIACGHLYEGLSSKSKLPPILLWPHLCYSLTLDPALYQVAIDALINILGRAIEGGPDYMERIFEHRSASEPYISNFEERHKLQITKSNLGFHVFYLLTQGLKLSLVKNTSLCCMKKYFKIKYLRKDVDEKNSSSTLAYLAFIYFCTSDDSFYDFIESTKLKSLESTSIEDLKVPVIIHDFLLSDLEIAQLTMVYAAHLFNCGTVDSIFKYKFLQIFLHIFKVKTKYAYFLYHIIKEGLSSYMMETSSIHDVSTIAEFMISIIDNPEYEEQKLMKDVDELFEKYNILTLRGSMSKPFILSNLDRTNYGSEDDVKVYQEMTYRSICSIVEGETLED